MAKEKISAIYEGSSEWWIDGKKYVKGDPIELTEEQYEHYTTAEDATQRRELKKKGSHGTSKDV